MSLYRTFMRYLAGGSTRNKGVQNENPSSYASPSATPVNADTAMSLSAVWACVKLISESIGSLPLNVYKIDSKGTRTLDLEHPVSRLFRGKINRWQTRAEYMECITYQISLLGNNYSRKQRGTGNKLIGLEPLMSNQMQVELTETGAIQYRYTEGGSQKLFDADDIWHNKLFGNAIIGLSPLGHARNSIGIAQAAENSTTKIYSNGGKPSGVLTIDKLLTAEQRAQIKKNFEEMASGENERLFVLEAAMKYDQVSLSPQDIELLASRKFQIEDICRFFGVPSILVNDSAANTSWGSGIQQIVQGFYKFGLRPYLERYEASILCNLFDAAERHLYEVEFDFSALLRPDQTERIKVGKEAVTGGIMTPNQVRASEGWAPLEGGDSLYLQQQMTPLKQLETLDRSKVPNVPEEKAGNQGA